MATAGCSIGSGSSARPTTTSTPVSAFRTIPSVGTTAPNNATTVITGGGSVATTGSSSGSGGSSTTAKSSTVATTGKTYVVQAGDFPIGIAKKLGVSLDALLAANGMTASNFSIHPGQKLNIPAGATGTTTPDHTTTTKPGAPTTVPGSAGVYTVQAGDSWFAIAKRLGVDANAMAALNGMTINTAIHPGEKLKVPASATNATTTTATTAKS